MRLITKVAIYTALVGLGPSCGDAGSSSPESAAPTTSIAPAVTTPTALGDLVADTATDQGWAVPAGEWRTGAFDTSYAFTSSTDLYLIGEETNIVYFAVPNSNNLVIIAKTDGIWNGRADVPVPGEPAALAAAIEANPAITIVDSGVSVGGGSDVPWWEMTIDEKPHSLYPCRLGTTCVFSSFAGEDRVHALQGERVRQWNRNDLQLGLSVHATGSPDGLDRAIEAGMAIATSLRAVDPADRNPAFLGLTDVDGVPAGERVVHLRRAALRLDLEEPVSNLEVFSNLGIAAFENDLGAMYFIDPVWLDASAEAPEVDELPIYSTNGPTTASEISTYLAEFTEIIDEGTAILGGADAVWWELGDPVADRATPCERADPEGLQCALIISAEETTLIHDDRRADSARAYFFPDSGLTLWVGAFGQTVDTFLGFNERFLEGLMIEATVTTN